MSKVKRIFKVVLKVSAVITILGILGFSGLIGYQVADGLAYMNAEKDTKYASEYQLKEWGYDIEAFEAKYEKKLFYLDNKEGYTIPFAVLGYTELEEKDTVILVHGLGGDHVSVYPQAEMYLEAGYNVVAIDQRASGESENDVVSFGYYEKDDISMLVDFVKVATGDREVIVHGFSMGAATTGLYGATDHAADHVKAIILDSSFDSMESMFTGVWDDMGTGLPSEYAVFCGNIALKAKFGFGFKDADVAQSMKNCKTPTLVIQSLKDDLSTEAMGKVIYENIATEHKSYWAVDSDHIMGYIDAPIQYTEQVLEFIDEVGVVSSTN